MIGTFERRDGGAFVMLGHEQRDVDAIDESVRSDGWPAVFRRILDDRPLLLGALRRNPQRLLALRVVLDRLAQC